MARHPSGPPPAQELGVLKLQNTKIYESSPGPEDLPVPDTNPLETQNLWVVIKSSSTIPLGSVDKQANASKRGLKKQRQAVTGAASTKSRFPLPANDSDIQEEGSEKQT